MGLRFSSSEELQAYLRDVGALESQEMDRVASHFAERSARAEAKRIEARACTEDVIASATAAIMSKGEVPSPAALRRRIARDRQLRSVYGITIDQWDEMFTQQGNRCATCRTPSTTHKNGFVVDHCHRTNKVRGILCQPCNVALGNVRDNPDTLRALASYLEERM